MQNQGIMKATSLQVESPLFPDSTAEELGGTFGALREVNLPLYHLNLCTIHARQNGSTSAIPVLELEQNDVDQPFVEFDGTSAADGSRSLSSNTGESGGCVGKIRVTINGVTRWLRVYEDHT